MHILLCPDKFKGSLSALEVCQAIGRGLAQAVPTAALTFHPMADGGDGSLEVLARHLDLQPRTLVTTDPLGREITAGYVTSGDAAFIELASASGLVLLQPGERNPLTTSSWGTGTMIADALAAGFRRIYLFLGGSATNDAGMGIAAALGCRFWDAQGQPLQPIGAHLSRVKALASSPAFAATGATLTLLCDVTNPLYGPDGAAHVYARQKGATEAQVAKLDEGLRHIAHLLAAQTGIDVAGLPGSGAAGGVAACLVALLGARLVPGFDTIAALTGLENHIQAADRVICGEGKLDSQSLQGKVVDGVAALCRKHGKPLVLFVGKCELDAAALRQAGIAAVYAIADEAADLADAMHNGAAYLTSLAGQAAQNGW
ncbi:MAG: glycerate kinase [Bacteroidia bacterium]